MNYRNILLTILAVCLSGTSFGCQSAQAIKDAERDIALGKLNVKYYGLPSNAMIDIEYNRLLKERYGLQYLCGGCVVYMDNMNYTRSYNKRIMKEIRSRFGEIDFKAVYLEAKQIWRDKQEEEDLWKVDYGGSVEEKDIRGTAPVGIYDG